MGSNHGSSRSRRNYNMYFLLSVIVDCRNVKRVMRESIMNDLRDEIRIRNRGRERRRRFKSFANARDISVNKFLIVKEVLKLLKSALHVPEIVANPFTLNLCLSLTSLKHYRQPLVESLKGEKKLFL